MRRFIAVVFGLFGLWIFSGSLMSVAITEPGSFLPAMWSELLLGAVLLVVAALLWRGRAHQGAGRRAVEVGDVPRAGARG
ncbi:MAG: hypothetical protein MUC36_14435 [Planctomycetes bacterium]|jgi:hypothetical protein|nr:hypothetical protein [Planctomycetota bacterium]